MDLQQLLDSITPEIYQNLKRSVELGKWPDGRRLTKEQQELSLQAIIAYEHKHLPENERSGYVPPKNAPACESDKAEVLRDEPLTWK